jgi:hypothetical protein
MNVVPDCFPSESSISAVPLGFVVPYFVKLIDAELSMTSLPSCSGSSECDDNSGDDSCSRVADSGNGSGSHCRDNDDIAL